MNEKTSTDPIWTETNALFREMANGLPLMLWAHGVDGQQEMVNDIFCQFFGVACEEMKGDRWKTLMHPEDAADYLQAFAECFQEHLPFQREVRVRRADGQWRWLESWGRPRVNGDGEFRGFVGTSVDITDRKQSEQSLRQAHELLREERRRIVAQHAQLEAVYNAIGDGLIVWNMEGEVVLVNHAGARQCGFQSVEEFEETVSRKESNFELRQPDGKLVPVENWPFSRILRGERFQDVELFTRRTDLGKEWILSYSGEPVLDAGGEQILGVMVSRDVTQSRVSQRALTATDERYRTLFNSIDEGFCILEMVFDEDGHPIDYVFIETNPAFQRQTGLANAVGRTALELVPDLERRWIEVYARVAISREPERFVDESEPMQRTFDVECFPVGEPEQYRVALLFNDITERLRVENELRESHRRKDEYLAMLGHELRNPLAAVLSATELLKLSAYQDPMLVRASEVLERQSTHMNHLINGLLEVSRLARGKIHISKEALDLSSILHGVLSDHGEQFHTRGLTLETTIQAGKLWVLADPVRMAQILDNLVGNALKFTERPGEICVTAKAEDGFAVVHVCDTGIGIKAENLERVFDPFHQEDDDVARISGGLGLGLALARDLAELHDATLVARSDGLGMGADFELRIPLVERPKVPQAEPEPDTSPLRNILIVEDNQDAAEMLHGLLEFHGHRVEIASTGAEALASLRRQSADVVLCDIGLPLMSGHDLARLIRSDERLRHIKLVALTGYGQPEDRRESARAGFDEHLVKPIDLNALARTLRKL